MLETQRLVKRGVVMPFSFEPRVRTAARAAWPRFWRGWGGSEGAGGLLLVLFDDAGDGWEGLPAAVLELELELA